MRKFGRDRKSSSRESVAAEKEHAQQISRFSFSAAARFFHLLQHGQFRVKRFLFLRIIAGLHVAPQLHQPFRRFLIACDELQERRFARAVRPDEADALPFSYLEAHVPENDVLSIRRRSVEHVQHTVRAFFRRREMKAHGFPVLRRFEPLQPVQLRLAPSGLL